MSDKANDGLGGENIPESTFASDPLSSCDPSNSLGIAATNEHDISKHKD